jgi:hypothetical protein
MLYDNQGTFSFGVVNAGLAGISEGSVAWGDYDNDGDLDLLVGGRRVTGESISFVYGNHGGVFVDMGAGLPGIRRGAVAWADYDADGDLDLALVGLTSDSSRIACLYRNDVARPNTLPAAPGWIFGDMIGNDVLLNWGNATDAETPAPALSYNVRIGTTPGGSEITSAMSAPDGYRRVAQPGNAQHRQWAALALPYGTYYWSVQAVDGAFAGSPFAEEQTFTNRSGVGDEPPRELWFELAAGNPVTGVAAFRFGLPARARVRLMIHDVMGRVVARLVDETRDAGHHVAVWGGGGRSPRAGVYFATLEMQGRRITRRVVFLE